MKSIMAIKIGNMKDPNPETRGKVGLGQVDIPPMGDEDVKIKVAYCAICGSDPHLVGGIFGWKPPFSIGHEVCGVITELGKNATQKGLMIGDRVAGNFLHFCGRCYYCNNGQQQFCTGIPEGNLGMAEYVVWHESQVFKLPDTISLRKGCLLEPVSIAVRIADKLALKAGQRVAIVGGGPIGLLTLQVLKRCGATHLTVFEPVEQRRAYAKRMGADFVVNPLETDMVLEGLRLTSQRGYDAVIDASGVTQVVAKLPLMTAKCGTVLYAGMYPNDFEMPLNLFQTCYANEITITGIFVSPYTFPRAVQLMEHMDLDPFTEKSISINSPEEAFAEHLSARHLKVLVECNPDVADL